MIADRNDSRGSWSGGRRDQAAAMSYAFRLLGEGKPCTFAANVAGVPAGDLRVQWRELQNRSAKPRAPEEEPGWTPPSARRLLARVALIHGVTVDAMLSEDRRRQVVRARQEAYALIADELQWSQSRIGQIFSRDCSTVSDGIAAHRQRAAA